MCPEEIDNMYEQKNVYCGHAVAKQGAKDVVFKKSLLGRMGQPEGISD